MDHCSIFFLVHLLPLMRCDLHIVAHLNDSWCHVHEHFSLELAIVGTFFWLSFFKFKFRPIYIIISLFLNIFPPVYPMFLINITAGVSIVNRFISLCSAWTGKTALVWGWIQDAVFYTDFGLCIRVSQLRKWNDAMSQNRFKHSVFTFTREYSCWTIVFLNQTNKTLVYQGRFAFHFLLLSVNVNS